VPDFAASSRLMRMLLSFPRRGVHAGSLCRGWAAAASLPADDTSLRAGASARHRAHHRDWLMAEGMRGQLRAQWRALFKNFDAVICPVMPTPAYHTTTRRSRKRARIKSTARTMPTPTRWHGRHRQPARPARDRDSDRPFAAGPANRRADRRPWLEDRTPLKLAELIEREFGGFVPRRRFND